MFLRGDIWRAVAINCLQASTLLSLRDSRLAYTAVWDFFSFIGRFSIAFFLPFTQRWLKLKCKDFCCTRVFIWGPFSLCQTKQSATGGIIRGKMERHCLIETKLPNGISLRSKRFCLVSEQRKTEERDSRKRLLRGLNGIKVIYLHFNQNFDYRVAKYM